MNDTPFDQRSLIHRDVLFPGGPRIPKNLIFWKNGKNHPKGKNSKTSRDMPEVTPTKNYVKWCINFVKIKT